MKNLRFNQTLAREILFVLMLIVFVSGANGGMVNAQNGDGKSKFSDKTLIPSSRFDQQERLRVIVQVEVPTSKISDERMTAVIRNAQDSVTQSLQADHFNVVHQYEFIPFMALEVDRAGFEELLLSEWVIGIEEDKENYPFLLQSVPLIRADQVWAAGYTGAGQAVAILDTGVDKNNPALSSRVISEACFSGSGTSFCPGGVTESIAENSALPCNYYKCDHGTHVAGIVAANGVQGTGVAKDSGLIAIQVFHLTSLGIISASDSDIIKGLERVYELRNVFNISSVNLSLGGSTLYSDSCDAGNSSIKTAVDLLRSAGIATVIASGNNSSTIGITSPACISTAVSVGASTDSDAVASFSNSADILDLLAPGSNIYSTVPGIYYGTKSGTSMAAPHVAGAWALMKSAKPEASVTEVLQAFKDTGVPITDTREPDPQDYITKPRIDVLAALQRLLTPPAAIPTNIDASNGIYSDKVRVTWSLAEHATYYQVYRATVQSNSIAVFVANNITTSFFDDTSPNGAEPGTLYYYWVKGCNPSGCSDFSSTDAGWIHTDDLSAPSDVQASDGLFRDRVQITWNGVGEATFYKVFRNTTSSTDGATELINNSAASPFEDLSAVHETQYYYWVQACKNNGCSAFSEGDGGSLLDDFQIFLPLMKK